MLDTLFNGGPFMIVLLVLLGGIVLLGIFSALFGILATYIGINSALSMVPDISKISPHILINGLKTSLITSFAGGIIMLISTAIWYFFIKRHNLLVV